MVPPKEQWPEILAKMRDERYISVHQQAQEMKLAYNTMKKIRNGEVSELSLATLRKIHAFLEKEGY